MSAKRVLGEASLTRGSRVLSVGAKAGGKGAKHGGRQRGQSVQRP